MRTKCMAERGIAATVGEAAYVTCAQYLTSAEMMQRTV